MGYTIVTETVAAREFKESAELEFPALIELAPLALEYFYHFLGDDRNTPGMPNELRSHLSNESVSQNSVMALELMVDLFTWIAEEERRRQED